MALHHLGLSDKRWPGFDAPSSVHHGKVSIREGPSLIDPALEVLSCLQGIAFFWSPPLWAMGLAHTLQALAHGVGSHKDK
jgi:hypothetical protein